MFWGSAEGYCNVNGGSYYGFFLEGVSGMVYGFCR